MDHSHIDMNETLITLTSDIVAAHVSNNAVSSAELTALIPSIYAALAGLGQAAPAPEAAPLKPAVSVRASIKPSHITCLDCGMELKMLKRHLNTHHGLTPDGYRARWGLNADYPLVAPDYAEKRRDLAMAIGLGRQPGAKRGRKPKA